jgi:hypothetical protein
VNVGVASGADDKRLASAIRHDSHPFRLRLSGLVEVGELADLVHLHLVRLSAELTPSEQEPMNQFRASDGGRK